MPGSERFSKGGAMSLLLEVIVSLGIVIFLFWYFYLKTPPPSANFPDSNKSTLENYQGLIDSAKMAKCISEAQTQQAKDDCLKQKETGEINVISPNGGETWTKGQNVNIKWNAQKDIKFVNIRLQVLGNSDAQNFNAAIASNIPNTGSYNWVVQDLYAEAWGIKTLPQSDKYSVTLEDSQRSNIYDSSDSVFSIK